MWRRLWAVEAIRTDPVVLNAGLEAAEPLDEERA
jgi:hypothetical protein